METPAQSLNPPEGAKDEALYQKYRNAHDEDALGALINRHWQRVFRIACRIVRDPSLAEDAAQQTFVTLVRGRYRGDGSVAAFLSQTAANEARHLLHARKRRTAHELAARGQHGGGGRGGDGRGDDADLAALVDAHLSRLPEDLRVPVVLRYAEGFTHDEVAKALGLASGTASSRLRRGLEKLRESLTAAGYAALVPSLEQLMPQMPLGAPVPSAPSSVVVAALAVRAGAKLAKVVVASIGACVVTAMVAFGLLRGIVPAPATGGNPAGLMASLPKTGAALKANPVGSSDEEGNPPVAAPGDRKPVAPRPAAPEGKGPRGSGRAGASTGEKADAATTALLTGRVVVAPGGSPVPEARVGFFESYVPESGKTGGMTGGDRATTSADGDFQISARDEELQPDGTIVDHSRTRRYTHFWLVAHGSGFAPAMLPILGDDLLSRKPIIIELAPGGAALVGRVVDRTSGAAVAGVMLEAEEKLHVPAPFDTNAPCIRLRAKSDLAGEFTMNGFAAGDVRLHPVDERFVTPRAALVSISVPTLAPAIVLVEAAARVVVELSDATGAPVAEFTAELRLDNGDPGQSVWGRNGRAEILQVAPGAHMQVLVSMPGKSEGTVDSEAFDLAPGEERVVKLTLPATAEAPPSAPRAAPEKPASGAQAQGPFWRLAGEIEGDGGGHVGGAKVSIEWTHIAGKSLLASDAHPQHAARDPVVTNADGRFAFEALPASGSMAGNLSVEASGYAKRTIVFVTEPALADEVRRVLPPGAPVTIEVISPGDAAEHAVVRLERTAALALVVRPPQGFPAARFAAGLEAGAQVAGSTDPTSRPNVEAQPDGRVRVSFDGIAAGARVAVALRIAGGTGLILDDLAPCAAAREVALPEGTGPTLGGRILGEDGRPIERASVVVAIGGLPAVELWKAGTDAAGAFRLADLPRQKLTLWILADAHHLRTLTVEPGGSPDLGDIRLDPLPHE